MYWPGGCFRTLARKCTETLTCSWWELRYDTPSDFPLKWNTQRKGEKKGKRTIDSLVHSFWGGAKIRNKKRLTIAARCVRLLFPLIAARKTARPHSMLVGKIRQQRLASANQVQSNLQSIVRKFSYRAKVPINPTNRRGWINPLSESRSNRAGLLIWVCWTSRESALDRGRGKSWPQIRLLPKRSDSFLHGAR